MNISLNINRIFLKRLKGILFILSIIFISDDTLLFGTNADERYLLFKRIFVISIFVVLLGIWLLKNGHVITNSFLYGLALSGTIMFTAVINGDIRSGYFYKCIIVMFAVLFVNIITMEQFVFLYEKLMFFLAAASVIIFCVAMVSIEVFSIFPVLENSVGNRFYNLGLSYIPINTTLRNFGIFREPGIYQIFLILALLFHIYNGPKIKRVVVYTLALIFTYSTTGYIALGVLLLLYFVKYDVLAEEKKKKWFVLVIVIVGILYLAMVTDLLSSEGQIFSKFVNKESISRIARFASIVINIQIFCSYPFFGAGLDKMAVLYPQFALERYGIRVTDNTNMLLSELATYGLLYGFIFMIAIKGFTRKLSNRLLERILIFVIIVVLFCGEKMAFSPIIYIIFFYGLQKERIINWGREERVKLYE